MSFQQDKFLENQINDANYEQHNHKINTELSPEIRNQNWLNKGPKKDKKKVNMWFSIDAWEKWALRETCGDCYQW